jgi:predicted RNA-binding Zn ribbon-like protein
MIIEPSPSARLIRDFINTTEPQLGTDQLTSSAASECLQRLGVVTGDVRLPATDLTLLIGVREGLREVLLGHAGHQAQASVLSELDRLLGGIPLTLRLSSGEASVRAAEDRVVHQVIAGILSAVITAPPEEWARLKVCARDSCRWAFFDASRNRSGRWCSMAGCGNIVKMRRAYRTRRAALSTGEAGSQVNSPASS